MREEDTEIVIILSSVIAGVLFNRPISKFLTRSVSPRDYDMFASVGYCAFVGTCVATIYDLASMHFKNVDIS
jgi:ABC-type enterochelin transport system permease subunit